jgi:hypothetical protein
MTACRVSESPDMQHRLRSAGRTSGDPGGEAQDGGSTLCHWATSTQREATPVSATDNRRSRVAALLGRSPTHGFVGRRPG